MPRFRKNARKRNGSGGIVAAVNEPLSNVPSYVPWYRHAFKNKCCLQAIVALFPLMYVYTRIKLFSLRRHFPMFFRGSDFCFSSI